MLARLTAVCANLPAHVWGKQGKAQTTHFLPEFGKSRPTQETVNAKLMGFFQAQSRYVESKANG